MMQDDGERKKPDGNGATSQDRRLTRRIVLAACAGLASSSGNAATVRKKSKADAGYQSQSKSVYSCAACNFFRAPVSCVIVEGAVNRNGWCKLYSFPD
jgi:hypothetical protein